MTDTETRSIVVEEDFPHAPALLWRAISDGTLMVKWLMPPSGFAPVVGQDFTFQTKAAGAWDGVIRCRVLEVDPQRRLAFAWTGGDAGNQGYGTKLETNVTMTLTPVTGRYAVTGGTCGFCDAVERSGVSEHERRLENRDGQAGRCVAGDGVPHG